MHQEEPPEECEGEGQFLSERNKAESQVLHEGACAGSPKDAQQLTLITLKV